MPLALAALAASGAHAAAAPTPRSFYGVWTDDLSLPRATRDAELDRQASTGVGVIREHVNWSDIERSPGHYDFASLDDLVARAAVRGLRILPILLSPPAWESTRPRGNTSSIVYPPRNPLAMAAFAARLVKRYGPKGTFWCCHSPYLPIRAWQVWNEPDWPAWWGGRPSPFEYALLLRVVSLAIHLADPRADVVLAGLTSRAAAPGSFLDQLYDQGVSPFFDTLAIHPYGADVATVVQVLRDTRAIARRRGDARKPIWATEYGWSTGGLRTNLLSTPACHAALMYSATRRLAEMREELNLRGIVAFAWNDRPPTLDIWPYYAGLVGVDGTPKPALAAFTAAIAGELPPAGTDLREACPADRLALG